MMNCLLNVFVFVELRTIELNIVFLRNPPWWNRRTRMERTLCAIAGIALVMCLAMTMALAFIGYHYQKNMDSSSALKPSAHRLVNDANEDIENNVLDTSQRQRVCLTPGCVKAVLVEKETEPNEPSYFVSMRNMYKSCMNLNEIEKAGNKPLSDLLQSFGGWPTIEGSKWNESAFDWLDTLIKFRHTGFSHDLLMDLSVTPDFRNNTRHVIDVRTITVKLRLQIKRNLDQASLGMPDRTYLLRGLNDSAVKGYYKLMVESAVMLGADRQTAEQEMLDALHFETILANYSLPREERRNISLLYNKMNISQIEKLAPNTKWSKYFNSLLNDPISSNDEIIVNVPTFIKKVDELIPRTDKRILANYMIWRVVLQSFATLGKQWRELAQEYNRVITGQDREEPRWEQCMASLTGSLGIALSSLYVRHHFRGASKDMAMEMVTYIHREFLKILDEVDWMDAQTVRRARDKAKAISTYIGYPEELLDEKKVGELYEMLNLTLGSYFENVQKLRRWSTNYAFDQLRKPNMKGDWRKHARAAVVNAYYNALENSIEFPAGILQGSFFGKDRPNYLNFGAIGFVIGHEITHGFDDRGRQFDKDGNNRNWWDHETDLKFRERTQCIIEQYSNYTVTENALRVNGINTQGENIADNGGLKEAYRAYKNWVADHSDEPSLPGLKYTPTQLFWISAANVWCGKHRPEVLKLRVLVGSHSPSQFRFNCPKGTPMNPEKKCSVW
ncbi:membrane metallo-endopeptidase-like 1 [Leptotrombidium deliense]|uniref:Membrane metallo-endopeptidase-like 1 n=1 Tax=Leptotrombidium deliense TaxID=299467 RepID=A0A443SDN8_9ACAR|nr:membrane metallo-endopeptidase-like 1 [Leptotrombidium deliense]